MKREDVIGISSLVFSPLGEAFYSCSSSELERINVSAARSVRPKGEVEVAADKRVPVVEETIVPVKTYVCGTEGASTSTSIRESFQNL